MTGKTYAVCEQEINFNSHAHVERDVYFSPSTSPALKNFNSHAHVERDYTVEENRRKGNISTHTLTWSVTKELGVERIYIDNFNSHAHVERDQYT